MFKKMKSFVVLLLSLSLLSITSCKPKEKDSIMVLMFNKKGDVVEKLVPMKKYKNRLTENLQVTTKAIQESLVQAEISQGSDWEVDSVVVGLGIVVGGSVSSLINLDAKSRVRFIFSNQDNEWVP